MKGVPGLRVAGLRVSRAEVAVVGEFQEIGQASLSVKNPLWVEPCPEWQVNHLSGGGEGVCAVRG